MFYILFLTKDVHNFYNYKSEKGIAQGQLIP